MRPLVSLAAAVALAFLVYAEPAHADCAAPQTAFAPVSGAELHPGHGDAVHVFVPTWIEDEVSVVTTYGSRGGNVDAVRVATTGAFDVYRVALDDLDHDGAGERVVRVQHRGVEYDARYPIVPVPAYSRAPGPIELVSAERVSDHWTCSYTEAWQLTPSLAAPAYLVEYATTAAAIDDGTAERIVLPPNTNRLFGSDQGDARINLGHVSCLGATLDESLLDGPLYVRISALPRHGRDTTSAIYELGAALTPVATSPPATPTRTASVAPPPARSKGTTSNRVAYLVPFALAFAAALLLGTLLIARRRIAR